VTTHYKPVIPAYAPQPLLPKAFLLKRYEALYAAASSRKNISE
jgi:hypothetical protein